MRIFLTIYCHSPGGDAAAALSDTAFYTTTYIHSPQGDNAMALAECSSVMLGFYFGLFVDSSIIHSLKNVWIHNTHTHMKFFGRGRHWDEKHQLDSDEIWLWIQDFFTFFDNVISDSVY